MISNAHHTTPCDAATNLARQILYRFAACTLVDPRRGGWHQLTQFKNDHLIYKAAALLRSLTGTRPREQGPGEQPLSKLNVQTVLDRLPDCWEAHNSEYERTFGLLVSSPCPPYESEYIDSKFVFQRSNTLADVNGFYTAFGLKIPEDRPERSDHIVLELEFMAHLISLERAARELDTLEFKERVQICREGQERFLREHLTWWAPAFAKLMNRASPRGYYAAVATFLGALIAMERAIFNLPIASKLVQPSVPEARELCDGCQISSSI